MSETACMIRESVDAREIHAAVARVLSGDVESFGIIVDAYRGPVWKWAAYALEDLHETQEIVQQTFVEAFRHIEQFEQGRNMGGWLFGIARNVVRQRLRKRMRRDRWFRLYEESLRWGTSREWPDPNGKNTEDALRVCLDTLPTVTRAALDMRYEQGYDYDRIAASLKRSVAAARQLLQRTREKLRRCIEERVQAT